MDRRDFLKGMLAAGVVATAAPAIAESILNSTPALDAFKHVQGVSVTSVGNGWNLIVMHGTGYKAPLGMAAVEHAECDMEFSVYARSRQPFMAGDLRVEPTELDCVGPLGHDTPQTRIFDGFEVQIWGAQLSITPETPVYAAVRTESGGVEWTAHNLVLYSDGL